MESVQHAVVGDEQRRRAAAAGAPDVRPVDHLQVGLLAVRDLRSLERPARLLAVVADRDRDQTRGLTRHGRKRMTHRHAFTPRLRTAPAPALRLAGDAPRVGGGRGARRRLPLQLGPLLPAPGRSGGQPLRGPDRARGDGRGHRARRARLAGDLQRLPQPRVPRRRPPHDRPHLRRAGDPRDRRRLVRARLRRVRLRVRDGRDPPDCAGGGAAAHRVAAGQAQAAAAARAHADPDRRRRGQAHAQARRPPRATSGTRSATSTCSARRTRSSTSTARTRAATRPPSSARGTARTASGTRSTRPASRTSSSASPAAPRATTSGRCASSSSGGTQQ